MIKKLRFYAIALVIISSILLLDYSCNKENEDTTPQEDSPIEFPEGFGLLPSPPGWLQTVPIFDTTQFIDLQNKSTLETFSLTMPPPVEQEGAECAAYATTYAARSFHYHKDLDFTTTYRKNELFSSEFVYNLAKAPGDCDKGMSLAAALDHLKNVGVCTLKTLPTNVDNCSTTGWDPYVHTSAECYKIFDYESIPIASVYMMKKIISHGYPIIIGVKVDKSKFLDPKLVGFGNDLGFVWKEKIGDWEGYPHVLVISGWNDTKKAWKVMNSWGTDWGVAGYGWIDYKFLFEALISEPEFSPTDYHMFAFGTGPPDCIEADSIVEIAGNGSNYLNGIVGQELSSPIEIMVKGFYGEPVEGIKVNFSVLEGSVKNEYVRSDSTGIARNYWTLGSTVGEQILTVRAYKSDESFIHLEGSQLILTAMAEVDLCEYDSIIDTRDGQEYKTIEIGTQTWFAENLNYTIGIPNVTDNNDWEDLDSTAQAWCYFDNDATNGNFYGALYTFNAALNACPSGWHLPSDSEWKTLEMHLGMSQSEANNETFRGTFEGRKIKSTYGWVGSNGTNESCLNALPGGSRHEATGHFIRGGGEGHWWTSSEYSSTRGWYRTLYGYSINRHKVSRYHYPKGFGYSVRCLKN